VKRRPEANYFRLAGFFLEDFLAAFLVAFLATFFLAAFLAAFFLVAFLATFFLADFLAAFLAGFLAAFLAVFFALVFLTEAFLAFFFAEGRLAGFLLIGAIFSSLGVRGRHLFGDGPRFRGRKTLYSTRTRLRSDKENISRSHRFNIAKKDPHSMAEQAERTPLKAILARERVLLEGTDEARDLYNQSSYGVLLEDGKLQLSLLEGLFLSERGRINVVDGRGKNISFESYLRRAQKVEPEFWVRYCVFKDMRSRGYVVKTALKFGADFRVYDRGVKPGEDHARWVVYPVHEGERQTWFDFAAKNRVAHSTKKRLMIGIVDDEGDVTYYEIRWVRP
jgi:tRNA-intron endonuclease, archaea type